MDLLQACDEMKGFIDTAQKLIESWEATRTTIQSWKGPHCDEGRTSEVQGLTASHAAIADISDGHYRTSAHASDEGADDLRL